MARELRRLLLLGLLAPLALLGCGEAEGEDLGGLTASTDETEKGACPTVEEKTLIISEYSEGSGNHKYLEIYNPTMGMIDLLYYGFPNVRNGAMNEGEHDYWNEFTPGAVIMPGDFYVICHPQVDNDIMDKCDQTHAYLSNGNDGYCLVKGTETTYTMVDCVGHFGPDPGDGWAVCGVPEATKDRTLQRKNCVAAGNKGEWTVSAGTTAEDCEWVLSPTINDWSGLGKREAVTLPPSPAPTPAPTTPCVPATLGAKTVFFSEYAEGSSNNKYLEIYNPTDAEVDLSGYALANAGNGADTIGTHDYWTAFEDGAKIAAGGFYLICHPSADQATILDKSCHQTHSYLSNGDDGYCLMLGTEDSHTKVDCIGDFGADPGSGWPVCGTADATKDTTLVRKATIMKGNGGCWTASAGTTTDDCEWTLAAKDDFSNLAAHAR